MINSEIQNIKLNINIKCWCSFLAQETWEVVFEDNNVDNFANK